MAAYAIFDVEIRDADQSFHCGAASNPTPPHSHFRGRGGRIPGPIARSVRRVAGKRPAEGATRPETLRQNNGGT